MTVVDTGVLLALVEVRFDGTPLRDHVIQEVRVQDSLSLPAAFSITFTPADLSRGTDPLGIEGPKPTIGTAVEIRLAGASEKQREKLLDGEVTAIEPSFGPDGIRLVASGYDRAHRLHRGRKTRTFQKMTTTQIVRKLAGEAGLSANVGATAVTHEFVQQNNETDWEFLKRLASMQDFETFVDGRQLVFRQLPRSAPAPLRLEFGENTSDGARLHSFYPRASAAQQVKDVMVRSWDPYRKTKIEAQAVIQQPPASIGIQRSAVNVFGASTITVADAPVATQAEARDLANSLAAYVAEMFVGAFGNCEGNPKIRAGTLLDIKGLGADFSGKYRVSSSTHVYGGSSGYVTSFEVLGRSPRDLLDLARPVSQNVWGDSLVVGVVTNNQDDEKKLGRVRVKYPTLDGEANEGAWARVVGTGAGKSRGQMMLPQVGDEVLIGFEGGDPHKPYVLGALWNGVDKPAPEHTNPEKPNDRPDGSYVLRSPKLIDMAADGNINIKTQKGDMLVEVKGQELTLVCGQAKIVMKRTGEIQIVGANITVEAQATAKLKGATVGVEGTGPVTVKGATVAIN